MKKIVLTVLALVMLAGCAAEAVPATKPEPIEASEQAEIPEPPASLEAQPVPTPPQPSPPEDVTRSIEFPHPLLPPPIFYDPPPPPFVPPPVEISEFGRQVAEEFLSEFHSIFSFGFRSPDGSYSFFTGETLDGPPLVWHGFQDIGDGTLEVLPHFFDRDGNRIEGAIFAGDYAGDNWMPWVALGFSLRYLGNDGIPDIFISKGILETCSHGIVMYSFVDGEYREVYRHSSPLFFFDYSGRVVVLEIMREGWDYFHLDFTPDGAEITRIPLIDWDAAWESGGNAFARQLDRFHAADFWENEHPIMFNSNLPLTHIRPLAELQEEFTEAITASLLADAG